MGRLAVFCALAMVSGCAANKDPTTAKSSAELGHWKEARAQWEKIIPDGMTEQDFGQLIQQDAWASQWMKPPQTMTPAELSDWARRRELFVGHIHRERAFQEAVRSAAMFHVYSCQGIPSTTSQLTVVCAADPQGVWRVRYRAVRERPCF